MVIGIDPNYEFGETVFESYTTNNSNYTEYITELTVYSNAGDSVTCSDKIEGIIRVTPKPEAEFVTDKQVGNYGTYLMDGTKTKNSSGDRALPENFNFNWLISDGPYDTVNIFNSCCDLNGVILLPSPDSLFYRFNYLKYGEDDSTKICLIVSNKLDQSNNIIRECADTTCKNVKIDAWGDLLFQIHYILNLVIRCKNILA